MTKISLLDKFDIDAFDRRKFDIVKLAADNFEIHVCWSKV